MASLGVELTSPSNAKTNDVLVNLDLEEEEEEVGQQQQKQQAVKEEVTIAAVSIIQTREAAPKSKIAKALASKHSQKMRQHLGNASLSIHHWLRVHGRVVCTRNQTHRHGWSSHMDRWLLRFFRILCVCSGCTLMHTHYRASVARKFKCTHQQRA
jgi:hypothetical protein